MSGLDGMGVPPDRTVYEEYIEFLANNKWYAHADNKDTGELAYHALGLAGEGGEFVDLVKKVVRDLGYNRDFPEGVSAETHARLIDELGDVCWYFSQLELLLGISHDELMKGNMAKLNAREKAGGRQHVR